MSYIVTARKWRPTTFEEVVGQQHVSSTLKNAILQNRLGHAYIFSGPRGVGKTTVARILARVLNCARPAEGNPCNECESCREISGGRNVDVFEIDGASNRGVEEIRNLREAVRYAPAKSQYKVYIIDEVHMLTKEAFNALLKTLEEPPSHVLFIFATTEVQKVPPTILSRCQRFDFRRIAIGDIIDRLRFIAREENITIDDDALLYIAKKGDGSMRDAQSIFDQVVAFSGTTVSGEQVLETLNVVDQDLYFDVTAIIRERDTKRGLHLVAQIVDNGYDMREFLSGLAEHFRNILTVVTTGSTDLIETSAEYRERYKTESKHFSDVDLIRYMRATIDLERDLRWSAQPRLRLESGMVELVKMEKTEDLQLLITRLEDLKKNVMNSENIPIRGTANAGWSQQRSHSAPLPGNDNDPPAGGAPSVTPVRRAIAPESPAPVPKSHSPAPVQKPPQAGKIITSEEAFARWAEYVTAVKERRINLGSVLSQSSLTDVQNGCMHLECDNEFQLNTLRRNREFLGEVSKSIFGAQTIVEVKMNNVQKTDEPVPKEEHPVLEALKRELGAEPM
jgi:DNA polymerase III subunit gamma/tau